MRAGIKAQGGKSRVSQMIGYLGQPGLSERETSWVGWPGSLYSCIAGSGFI